MVLSLRTAHRYKGVREALAVESALDLGLMNRALGSLHFTLLKEMITGLEAFA
ncbi:MAG: hypothetical protein ACO391_05965 [Pseudomonadales bacterium]